MSTIISRLEELAANYTQHALEIEALRQIVNNDRVSDALTDVLNFNDTANAFTRAALLAQKEGL